MVYIGLYFRLAKFVVGLCSFMIILTSGLVRIVI